MSIFRPGTWSRRPGLLLGLYRHRSRKKAERLLSGVLVIAALTGCEEAAVPENVQRVVDGEPEAGRAIIAEVACGVCHQIPGILGADGIVGPSLEEFARRQFIAGTVPNRPDLLVRWVREAPSLAPDTAMPDMPISEQQARHVAAYLYTLR